LAVETVPSAPLARDSVTLAASFVNATPEAAVPQLEEALAYVAVVFPVGCDNQ